MLKFKQNKLTLALLSSGLIALSTPTFAEETEEQKADAASYQAEKADVEVIQVKGLRGSIVESINTKRFSSSVVEAITAEDIGKLPDSSIAETIARLPGLTSQRLDGRSSRVSVRGFSENESGTTFNGREQVSISDNRGVEFDLYPSEVMSAVTVYKTPNASIEAEGIAGVINLETIKPLAQDERIIQFNAQYEKTSFDKLNPDGDDSGFRGTFSYLDKFLDDTLGVAIAYNTMSSPNQEKRWESWGYPDFEVDGENFSMLGGAKPFVRSSTLDRDSTMLVIESAPTDELLMTFDALYVNYKDHKRLRGIEIPFAWGQGTLSADTVDPETGFITSGGTDGQRLLVRNDFEDRDAIMQAYGFNAEYEMTINTTLEFDVSYSQVDRDIYSVESYSGTGRGDDQGLADNLTYNLESGNSGAKFTHEINYADYDLIQLGGPLSWGNGNSVPSDGQDGFINTPTIDDELYTLRLAATTSLDNGFIDSIGYGLSYRNRDKTKKSEGYYMTLDVYPNTLIVPEQYREGTVNLDFIGMGNAIAYNTKGLIDDGYYNLTKESLTDPKHENKSWLVSESITSAYLQANIDTELFGLALTGNIGGRYIYTDQSSQGSAYTVNDDGLVVGIPTNVAHDYSNFLPSLNLSLQVAENQMVRFGAAQTISRARMDEMNASIAAEYNDTPDDNGNFWAVSGGNPELEPKEATGYDLTYENYFSDEGYFSTAVFYKDITQWIFDGAYEIDMTGINDPATGELPATSTGTATGKVNGGSGDMWGYELTLALPLKVFHESLEGFGVNSSYTSISQNITDQNGNEFDLPGLSESIASVTFYYERDGLQIRANMRSREDFKGDVYGLGFDTVQVDIQGETIWDAQIAYDFGDAGFTSLDGLSVSFSGANLTNEPFVSTSGDNSLQVRDYQDYGKSYLLGFTYRM
ncbi:TonB-dependent receptor [Colwellia echini]|uniref:TonB-dependent receptor n=1 Tax=Colwellia echini TaxID=1982103 RepID=A0ABY3MX47_9GAMM|nr:TonB-dependent receptor [Colwellia echini]TYK65744.1 TonB-dependent receptor [Colwellia echini]